MENFTETDILQDLYGRIILQRMLQRSDESVWAGLNRVSMGKMATSCGNVEIRSGSIPDADFFSVISWYKIEFPDFLWDKNLFPMLLKFRNFPRLISERDFC
jgi:hypothetical protein